MFGFIAIKAARALATLLICVTAVFVVLRMAGDPADMLLPDDTPSEIKAEYRVRWGLEGSIPEQYWRYMAALSRGISASHSPMDDLPLTSSWRQCQTPSSSASLRSCSPC